jgi:hypothetical protein
VPELKEAIDKKLITTSAAHRVVSVITKENSSHWIALAQELPKVKLEKEIARVNPKVLTPEKIKYVSQERLKLELGVSEAVMADLKRAQEILSQKAKAHVSLEETLGKVLENFLKKEDPLQKSVRALEGQGEKTARAFEGKSEKSKKPLHQLCPGRVEIPFIRTHLPAVLKHQVHLRDKVQCTHVGDKGQRCSQRKWLQIHHKIPISHGGQGTLENLVTLCAGHHQLLHQ